VRDDAALNEKLPILAAPFRFVAHMQSTPAKIRTKLIMWSETTVQLALATFCCWQLRHAFISLSYAWLVPKAATYVHVRQGYCPQIGRCTATEILWKGN